MTRFSPQKWSMMDCENVILRKIFCRTTPFSYFCSLLKARKRPFAIKHYPPNQNRKVELCSILSLYYCLHFNSLLRLSPSSQQSQPRHEEYKKDIAAAKA